MPDKVILRRGDGTLLEASPEQAEKLRLLGYEPETGEQNVARSKAEAAEDYYSDQKLETFLEGAGAGLTFGASDYIFGDDETKNRARYNPGTRIGAEILGAVAPLFMTGGTGAAIEAEGLAKVAGRAVEEAGALGKAAKVAPTALLSEAARALAPGKGLTSAVTRGAIEGGVYGGTMAADHAYLDGDPITAEGVLHGIGLGAITGGALSALGHGIEAAGKAAKAAKIRAEQPPVPYGTLKNTTIKEFGALKAEVDNLVTTYKQSVKAADAVVNDVTATLSKAAKAAGGIKSSIVLPGIQETKHAYLNVLKAVEAQKFEQAGAAIETYAATTQKIADRLGVEIPDVTAPLKELMSIKSVARELSGFPKDVGAFASMTPLRLERAVAALEKAKSFPGTGPIIAEAEQNLSRSLGLELDSGLRTAWKAARQISKQEGLPPVQTGSTREPGIGARAVGYLFGGKAWVAAHAAGFGPVGSYMAYRTVRDAAMYSTRDLATTRATYWSRIRNAAANYLPKAGSATKTSAPYFGALSISLYGGEDKETDRRKLAFNRIKEINELAPTVKDTLFRAVEPLSVVQPKLAPALHSAGIQAFQALLNMVPKNPGVISALKPIWKPSDVQAIMLDKMLAVYHDPAGAAEYMLQTGKFDPIQVQTLKEVAPNTWQELRVGLLARITDPEVHSKLSYNEQIGLSVMLDVSLHTSMAPEYIATSQQIFVDRMEAKPANPRMGQSGGLPNPSDNVGATSAQKSTER